MIVTNLDCICSLLAVKSMPMRFIYLLILLPLTSCTIYGVVDECVKDYLVDACKSDEQFAKMTERPFDFKQCLAQRERNSIRVVCAQTMGDQ